MNALPLRVLFLIAAICSPSAIAAPVEITTPELRGAAQPQLAIAPSGRIHVVFGRDDTIYHTSSADGVIFGAPVKVDSVEKLALRMRRGPRIAVMNRTILVTAISHSDGNIHAWSSTDGGETFIEQRPLNSVPKSAREGMHATTGDGRGAIAVVWLDLRNKGTELWGRFSADAGLSWSEERSLYASPDGHICECCHPTAVFASSGELAVMWRNWIQGSRDLFAMRSRDHGRTFTAPERLGQGTWKLNACPMDGGSLAFDSDDRLHAAWRREASLFIHALGAPEDLLAKEGKQPVIGFTGQGSFVLWESNGALLLRRGSLPAGTFASTGSAASVAQSRDGSAIVAWEQGTGATTRLFVDQLR